MNLRITASYAATDGSMPESVDVAWDGITAGSAYPTTSDLLAVIDRLIGAPGIRSSTYGPDEAVRSAVLAAAPEAGSKFRAGVEIPMGTPLAFAANGFTLYPHDHEKASFPAGVAIEHVPAGAAMMADEHASRGVRVWRKETT